MTAKILLTASPHFRPDGRKHAYKFDARVGEVLLCVSHMPLLSGARALLKQGMAAADDELEMWYAGSNHFAMRGKVGELAEWRVRETVSAPRLAKWVPRSAIGLVKFPEAVANGEF